jgi:hypothetical protein
MYDIVEIKCTHSKPRRKTVLSNQFHDPADLSLDKELPVIIYRRLGEKQSWSGHCGEGKISDPTEN